MSSVVMLLFFQHQMSAMQTAHRIVDSDLFYSAHPGKYSIAVRESD